MKRRNLPGFGMGGGVILVTLLVLMLTTFAALSLVSALSDRRQSEKSLEATISYYKADSSAQQFLASVDELLEQAESESNDRQSYYDSCELHLSEAAELTGLEENSFTWEGDEPPLFSYVIKAGDTQELVVELELPYPVEEERYHIVRWATRSTADWSGAGMMENLWNGEALDG